MLVFKLKTFLIPEQKNNAEIYKTFQELKPAKFLRLLVHFTLKQFVNFFHISPWGASKLSFDQIADEKKSVVPRLVFSCTTTEKNQLYHGGKQDFTLLSSNILTEIASRNA